MIERSHHDMGGQPSGKVEPTEHDYADWERRVDATLVVSAPIFLQRLRVMARPGMTAERLDGILRQQVPDALKSSTSLTRSRELRWRFQARARSGP